MTRDVLSERSVRVPQPGDRDDLTSFLTHAVRLDDAAVVRLRARGSESFVAWVGTGFDVLACRVVAGSVVPTDTTIGADSLRAALGGSGGERFDPGFAMDSAWRGALPPADGFVHVDDVPARVLVELAEQGVSLAREQGSSHGPPVSLLDQEVLDVVGAAGRVAVPMRMVFALTAMGFVPRAGEIAPDELVRVRLGRSWLRLDARFGSVLRHEGGPIPLSVT